jgi:ATP-binding cassette subfamily C (CFTR/MRP) protein 1
VGAGRRGRGSAERSRRSNRGQATIAKGRGENQEGEESADTTEAPADIGLGGGGSSALNPIQTDVTTVKSAFLMIHTVWDGLLQIAIYSALLLRTLGPSMLYGLAFLLITIPVISVILRVLNRLNRHEARAKDARTKSTFESLANMKSLKLQGWERSFERRVADAR